MAETPFFRLYNPFMDTDGEVTWEAWGTYDTEEAAHQEIDKFLAGHARYPLRLYHVTDNADINVEQGGILIFENGDLKEWEELSAKEDFFIEGAFMISHE